MKDIFYNFVSKIIKLIVTFLIALFTVVIASDNSNKLYEFLNKHDYTDPLVQKAILSAAIAGAIGILQELIDLLYKLLLWIIKKYFKRLTVSIKFKKNKRNRDVIRFKPVNGAYVAEQVDIEINIVPAGKIAMMILKLLGLRIEVFFNPHIIDVTLENDPEWLNEKADTKVNQEQAVCISVLKDYRLGGSTIKPFLMTESIIILPKRVKKDTAHIDFKLTSFMGSKLSSALCESDMKDLDIECERG